MSICRSKVSNMKKNIPGFYPIINRTKLSSLLISTCRYHLKYLRDTAQALLAFYLNCGHFQTMSAIYQTYFKKNVDIHLYQKKWIAFRRVAICAKAMELIHDMHSLDVFCNFVVKNSNFANCPASNKKCRKT